VPPRDPGPEAPAASPTSEPAASPLVLDACCYANLFASGRIVDIVRDLPYQFSVVDVAMREISFIRKGGSGDDAQEPLPIDWRPLTSAGVVEILRITGSSEEAGYVSLLEHLDDGEAATLAVAINRTSGVATDDRKARRHLMSRAPHLLLRSTLDLLHEWCRHRSPPDVEITQLLKNVRERGRFLPPRGDPLAHWWTSALGSG
jgi:hypothetical protein